MFRYDPTDEQRAIINSDDSALVIAGPGRGKTATAIAAANSWLARTPVPSRVLFTSFSNAAVKRIAAAAGINSAEFDRRVQFRTFHSIAMEILRDFGRYVGLRKPARALDRTEERIIAAERGWDLSDQITHKAALKELATTDGLVAFELMVPLACSLLECSPTLQRVIGQRFPFVVVDEFQDTRSEQWNFLKLLGQDSRVMGFGDPNQMIYENQYQVALSRVSEFEKWKGVQAKKFDGPNFRCGTPAIVRFAEGLLLGKQEVPSGHDGVQMFSAYPTQRRAALAAIWTAIRRQKAAGSTIAFIVPSGKTARDLAAELRAPDPNGAVPVPVFAHIETPEGDLDAFRLAVCAAADWVTNQSEQGLQALAVSLAVFSGQWSRKALTPASVEQIKKRLRLNSGAASPLRDYLASAAAEPLERFADRLLTALEQDTGFSTAGRALRRHGLPRIRALPLGQSSLFDGYRNTRSAAGLEGTALSRAATTILSMYQSKGREFDFVVLVVEPRDHSSKSTPDELRRLYYVSATRARKWLGVLHVPKRAGPILGPVLGQ